jgi:hypothetical protein
MNRLATANAKLIETRSPYVTGPTAYPFMRAEDPWPHLLARLTGTSDDHGIIEDWCCCYKASPRKVWALLNTFMHVYDWTLH